MTTTFRYFRFVAVFALVAAVFMSPVFSSEVASRSERNTRQTDEDQSLEVQRVLPDEPGGLRIKIRDGEEARQRQSAFFLRTLAISVVFFFGLLFFRRFADRGAKQDRCDDITAARGPHKRPRPWGVTFLSVTGMPLGGLMLTGLYLHWMTVEEMPAVYFDTVCIVSAALVFGAIGLFRCKRWALVLIHSQAVFCTAVFLWMVLNARSRQDLFDWGVLFFMSFTMFFYGILALVLLRSKRVRCVFRNSESRP